MSTPDLHARAARFFLLAEQTSLFKWFWEPNIRFWQMYGASAVERAVHLPALAATVRKTGDRNVLRKLARHPLPGVLLPEAVPWHDRLVEDWEVHRASSNKERRNLTRLALVRLDGCGMPDGMQRPSRLPEWLAEARRMVGAGCEPARTGPARTGKWQMEKPEALAALAAWRPAPRVITPPETLQKWVAFWRERRRSRDPIMRGIAAKGLLNLPEADLRAASIPMVPAGELLRELATAIPAAAEKTAQNEDYNYLPLLDWQPGENSPLPVAGVAEVVRAWLEVTSHNDDSCRQMTWWQLIRWDQTESIATCGMDLLPFLVRAAQTEKNEFVLWEMAQWKPATEVFTGTRRQKDLDLLRQLETAWQRHGQFGDWQDRASAWLAGIRLHQAGLASEPPDSFREAYLSAVAQEDDEDVLFVLAQWSPGTEAPAAFHREWCQGWQSRLGEKDEGIRHVAAFALVRRAVENGTGQTMRHAALEVWRTGTKTAAVTPRLASVPSCFHEVRAHLATGNVPDFEKEPVPPAQRQYPRLALPPGHIADREWRVEN